MKVGQHNPMADGLVGCKFGLVGCWCVRCFSRRGGKTMIGRLGKKWLAGLFILLSVLLVGCVNSEAYLLSNIMP